MKNKVVNTKCYQNFKFSYGLRPVDEKECFLSRLVVYSGCYYRSHENRLKVKLPVKAQLGAYTSRM